MTSDCEKETRTSSTGQERYQGWPAALKGQVLLRPDCKVFTAAVSRNLLLDFLWTDKAGYLSVSESNLACRVEQSNNEYTLTPALREEFMLRECSDQRCAAALRQNEDAAEHQPGSLAEAHIGSTLVLETLRAASCADCLSSVGPLCIALHSNTAEQSRQSSWDRSDNTAELSSHVDTEWSTECRFAISTRVLCVSHHICMHQSSIIVTAHASLQWTLIYALTLLIYMPCSW